MFPLDDCGHLRHLQRIGLVHEDFILYVELRALIAHQVFEPWKFEFRVPADARLFHHRAVARRLLAREGELAAVHARHALPTSSVTANGVVVGSAASWVDCPPGPLTVTRCEELTIRTGDSLVVATVRLRIRRLICCLRKHRSRCNRK